MVHNLPTKWDIALEVVLTSVILKYPSLYSIWRPMAFAYISFLMMFSFQNSKYFEILLLMEKKKSIDFEVSLPQIGQNGIGFGTPFGSWVQLW